jgi:crossover junction endodeoxyribonuclease RuvC
MIILGIDPGFADMGYGVIESSGNGDRCLAYGSVKTPSDMPTAARLNIVYDKLAEIIEKYEPERSGIEKLFFSKNVTSAMLVAEARGVIRLCMEKHGLDPREVSPAEVKIAVCGHGAAGKVDVQKMTKVLLNLREVPKPDDAADALAIAITVAHTMTAVARKIRVSNR